MNLFKTIKPMTALLRAAALVFTAGALVSQIVQASPYASCITNNAGAIQFYLNESGGNVTVTYEDSSVDPNYNGTTTGLNLASGMHSFALGIHTSYTISVFKTGSGNASVLQTMAAATPRGIDVNKRPGSPYFGYVYAVNAAAATSNLTIRLLNSDLSGVLTNGGGVAWINSSSDPYRIAVNDDDYLTVGSFSSAHSGVWRLDPTLSTNQLLLGPIGQTAGYAAMSQGDQFSRPLLIGNLQTGGSAVLYTVDSGTIPNVNVNQLNSVLVYSNITLATLPRITSPDLLGPEVALNISLQNNYPGITAGPANQTPTRYLYCSNRRDGPSGGSPTVCIYALTNLLEDTAANGQGAPTPGANAVWNSFYNGGVNDYFATQNTGNQAATTGPADSAISSDGKYFAALGYGDNHIVVCSLTNGIPDVSTLYTISNTVSQASAGRGLCWDAADNIYVSSSGGATFQEWTLGITETAITTGNASGPTGFSVALPSVTVGVYATNSIQNTTVSQANSYGNPTSAQFVISRSGSTASALTVFYTLGGTAPNGTYTASATSSVTIAAGQSSTNITITAVTDGIPRPTTSIILKLSGSPTYSLAPDSATLSLINTAPNELVASVNVPTMYNAFSNDYASITVTRWGDTNAGTFTASSFIYAGTATVTQDYTTPTSVTFNPGDVTQTSYIYPLYNGQLPVQTTSHPYVGTKTVIISMGTGTGYSGSTSNALLTILDQAYPTAPVLFADPLTSAGDAVNWGVTAANNNMQSTPIDNSISGTSQNSVIFGYNLQSGDPGDFGAIPLPPSGAATALRVTANKSAGAAAGVNLYPTNASFSGDYAVRFSMNIIQGDNNSVSTEGPLLGINHSGIATNWFTLSGLTSGWGTPASTVWESDGVWYWINADNDNSGGAYLEYTGVGGSLPNTGWQPLGAATAATFANSFKSNDFTGGVYWGNGLVSGESVLNGSSYLNGNWADVEIKQVNNIVTLSIDKTPVFIYTNTTAFTSGMLMLGYNDPFSSIGAPDGAVYFSNLQVVRLTPPAFSSGSSGITIAGGNVTLTFSSTDSSESFVLQSASSPTGPWTNVSPQPAFTYVGSGNYQVTTPTNGSKQFYRIVYY